MQTIDTEKMRECLLSTSATLLQNEQYLCRLDSFVGDGDHGVTVSRGFKKVTELLCGNDFKSIGQLFRDSGSALMASMGGAIGPVFGTIFIAAGKTCGDKTEIGTGDLYEMFESSLQAVKKIGNVKEGDRTLVDALSPTVEALREARDSGLPLAEALSLAEKYAKKGMEDTKGMVAKKGRAKFLMEKSIGYQDAGATTFYLIIKCFRDFFGGEQT